MSSNESYPFDKEADKPKDPQEELGHTALEGEGTRINVTDKSQEYPVEVTTGEEQDQLASLGYGREGADDFDPYNQT